MKTVIYVRICQGQASFLPQRGMKRNEEDAQRKVYKPASQYNTWQKNYTRNQSNYINKEEINLHVSKPHITQARSKLIDTSLNSLKPTSCDHTRANILSNRYIPPWGVVVLHVGVGYKFYSCSIREGPSTVTQCHFFALSLGRYTLRLIIKGPGLGGCVVVKSSKATQISE